MSSNNFWCFFSITLTRLKRQNLSAFPSNLVNFSPKTKTQSRKMKSQRHFVSTNILLLPHMTRMTAFVEQTKNCFNSTLKFQPLEKETQRGDRSFKQWDSISLKLEMMERITLKGTKISYIRTTTTTTTTMPFNMRVEKNEELLTMKLWNEGRSFCCLTCVHQIPNLHRNGENPQCPSKSLNFFNFNSKPLNFFSFNF